MEAVTGLPVMLQRHAPLETATAAATCMHTRTVYTILPSTARLQVCLLSHYNHMCSMKHHMSSFRGSHCRVAAMEVMERATAVEAMVIEAVAMEGCNGNFGVYTVK